MSTILRLLQARARAALLVAAVVSTASATSAGASPTLLLEASTGRILYAEDADDQWHPASLTKIMTAYLTFQALKDGRVTLETPITYSEGAAQQPPSKIGLPVGSTITIDMALQSIIVKSANDISVALAEAIGGSEAAFVEQMNATARRLGMNRTFFRNPHGLPAAEQVTTARDLARLSMAVLRDFPDRAHYWSQSQMQIGAVKITSHNGLFKSFEGTDGLKTGFICDSGYNVVASASRDGVRLLAVVLGQSTVAERNQRAEELLAHGYATAGWKALFGGVQTVASMPLSPGAKSAESIRESVVAMECNNRRMARAAAAARKRTKARRIAEAKKKQVAGEQRQATAKSAPAGQPQPSAPAASTPKAAAPSQTARPAAKPAATVAQ